MLLAALCREPGADISQYDPKIPVAQTVSQEEELARAEVLEKDSRHPAAAIGHTGQKLDVILFSDHVAVHLWRGINRPMHLENYGAAVQIDVELLGLDVSKLRLSVLLP